MSQIPENIKNMWLDAANEPRVISEPTQTGSHIDSLIEKLETENEALFLVIENLLSRLDEDVETLVGIKVPKRSTRKHMRQVAAAIANLRPEERKAHHDKAAAYFRRANPNFKADVFRKASGVSDGMERSDYRTEGTILERYKKVSSEIRHLIKDKGYPQKRAVAAALSMKRKGELEEETKDTGYDPRAAQAIANAYIQKRKLKNKKK